jgi:uncharacterized protein DUF748
MKLPAGIRPPTVRKALAVLAGLLLFWAVAGFLVLPGLLRPVAERKLSELLHRPVKLRRLALNPFSLSVTLDGLEIREKGGAGPFVAFERFSVNLEAVSLFKGGPVTRSITLTRPSVSLIRNEDGTYNVQDLLDEASRPKPANEKPLRFSLNNIRIEGGSLDFDDRPDRTKHAIRDIAIGIPFLSNIPSKVEITTTPVFHARVNGAPFDLRGSAKPFSQTHETTVDLNIADLDLPYYLAYVPKAMPAKLTSGRLDANLTLAFSQPARAAPRLILSGTAALRNLAASDGRQPLLSCERFEAALASFDVFGGRARLRSLRAAAPEVWVRRDAKGRFPVVEAILAPARKTDRSPAEPTKKTVGKSAPFLIEAAEIGVERGRVHYEFFSGSRPFQAVLQDIAVSLKGFSTAPGRAAPLEASARSDAGVTVKSTSTVSMDPLVLEGEFSLGGLPLKRYRPFYEELVRFDVEDGVLDLASKYRFAQGPDGNTTLAGLSAKLTSLRVTKRGEKEPFFQAPSIVLAGTGLDMARREATLGEVTSAGGSLAFVREKDGTPNLAGLMVESPAEASPAPPRAPWKLTLGRLALDGYTVKIQDKATLRPARYSLTKLKLAAEDFSTAAGSKGKLALGFGVDGKGTALAKGSVGFGPTAADLRVEVKGIPLVPIQPYVVQDFKVSLARGSLTADGELRLTEGRNGNAAITYSGNALVSDFLALDRATNLEFLRWDAFAARGMKAGYNPVFLEMSVLALSGFACDLTIEADGTTSLQRVVGAPASPGEGESEEAVPAVAAGSSADSPAAPPPPSPVSTPGANAAGEKVPIRIDTLTLEKGRIGLADHFIQPNYSGTLTNLAGKMTGLSTVEGTVATLDLRGSLANHSPLEIRGSVNPLAATAFADVKATFRDVDLPPFTPYSGKYAGYAIARGSLTMEVAYKLQNRQLTAQNRFLVDQFEFGEKIESPSATKLPVRLAVSLLRDKDGLIDLDLPIEGSLDDPKFRIGKVIWKVLGNLIGKAVTAPFSLLGKLLGGGGQEFSSVDFPEGRDTLDEAARKKLDGLAKALENRPALKLEATGRTSGEKDREGLRQLLLERKVKAQKLAGMAKKGEAPPSVDAVVVEEREYDTYLAKAYKKESFSKPRNSLGFAKTLPAPEMRDLMLVNLSVTDDDLRQLALARANAVKDYLTGAGRIEASRVFVLEPGGKPAESGGKAPTSRVDFSLR